MSERLQLPLHPIELQQLLPRVQLNLVLLVRGRAGESSQPTRCTRQLLSSCFRSGARVEWASGTVNFENVRIFDLPANDHIHIFEA
jgi:hypothetical protein